MQSPNQLLQLPSSFNVKEGIDDVIVNRRKKVNLLSINKHTYRDRFLRVLAQSEKKRVSNRMELKKSEQKKPLQKAA
tara:strand:+ start:2622 stop:2852 length:231 start_codon:yes stop_codon:yes gene_type:complete